MQPVRVVWPTAHDADLTRALQHGDQLMRRGTFYAAVDVADNSVVRQGMGLANADIERLRQSLSVCMRSITHGGARCVQSPESVRMTS